MIVFLLASLSCLTGFAVLNDEDKQKFASFCLTFIAVLVLVSLPTFFVQGVGFLRNGRGFQGLLNHPQVFGVFMAPLMAFLTANLLKVEIKRIYLLLPILGGLGLIMVTTQARTSLLSVLLALTSVYLVNLNFKVREKYKMAMGRTLGIGIAIIFLLGVFLQFNPDVAENVKNYALKNRGDEIGEAFYRSRGAGVEHHFNNFLESPLIGNGFGVFAKPHPKEEIIYVQGIPISASTEKGIVLFAVLEETGLIGFFLFSWFIIKMGKRAVASQDARFLAMFFSCLYVNFGEAVFFSPGGIGLYFWVLLGVSVGMSNRNAGVSNNANGLVNYKIGNHNDRVLANIL
ncbi:MAG: hypothetical protein MI867_25145 [Pseudomonadales bacterium]|nr:hypothetical protein [Pseudomonadales bacterium]